MGAVVDPAQAASGARPDRRSWVVGNDDSDCASVALHWAAVQAADHDVEIEIVRAWQYPYYDLLPASSWTISTTMAQDLERSINEDLAELAAEVTATHGTATSTAALLGPTVDVLLEQAGRADLLVVGSRGLGGVGRFALGSVSHRLASRAVGPLVIVPENAPLATLRRVVVGVDGSANSLTALRWAHSFAPRSAEIVAVSVWSAPDGDDQEPDDELWRDVHGAARDRFMDAIDALEAALDEPGRFDRAFVSGRTNATLASFAEDADLVVVGARGHTGVVGMITGSTATWMTHHLRCPTAVIPADVLREKGRT